MATTTRSHAPRRGAPAASALRAPRSRSACALARRLAASALALVVGAGLCGCTGPTLSERLTFKPLRMQPPYRLRLAPYKIDGRPRPSEAVPTGRPSPRTTATPVSDAPPRLAQRRRTPGARVSLSGRDLTPVYRWFSGKRNRQWILGDVVDVVASKEFFAQVLTTNAQLYMVKTERLKDGDDALIVMTYLGGEGQARANTTPRVMIHTGLTITARKKLRVRLAKTQDAARPVNIQVTAQGGAARGHGDDVEARGPSMQMRGVLVYDRSSRRWVWRAAFS